MRPRALFVLTCIAAALVGSACSSSEEISAVSSPEPAVVIADDASSDAAADEQASEPVGSSAQAAPPAGGRSATVTLDNGESWTFSIWCALEPQESAGSTIEFTVGSYDDPVNLDVTKFGDDSFNGAANISLYDSSTYETLWEATSLFGGATELTLEGSTLTGRGTFVEGDTGTGQQVEGQLVASC